MDCTEPRSRARRASELKVSGDVSEHSVEETYLPGGLEPLTEEEIERRP